MKVGVPFKSNASKSSSCLGLSHFWYYLVFLLPTIVRLVVQMSIYWGVRVFWCIDLK